MSNTPRDRSSWPLLLISAAALGTAGIQLITSEDISAMVLILATTGLISYGAWMAVELHRPPTPDNTDDPSSGKDPS